FRIDHVRGDNAVLSGIFFDSAPQPPSISVTNASFELNAANGAGGLVATVPSNWTAFNQAGGSDIGSQWAGGIDYTANTPLLSPAAGNQYCYVNMFNP